MFAAGVSPLIGLFVEDLHMSEFDASRLPTWALFALGVSVDIQTPYRIISRFLTCKQEFVGVPMTVQMSFFKRYSSNSKNTLIVLWEIPSYAIPVFSDRQTGHGLKA